MKAESRRDPIIECAKGRLFLVELAQA